MSALDWYTKVFVAGWGRHYVCRCWSFQLIHKAISRDELQMYVVENHWICNVVSCFLALIMILFDRIFFSYTRRLANKTIVVEKSKLNLLVCELLVSMFALCQGLSTGELLEVAVKRLKGGGGWDALVGRFSWWALDGPPIMEELIEPVMMRTVPSIEQLSLAVSFIRNCSFRYDDQALARVVEWGNCMRLKIEAIQAPGCISFSRLCYGQWSNHVVSALLEKSVQFVYRYSGFIQTIEYGFMSRYEHGLLHDPSCHQLVTAHHSLFLFWSVSFGNLDVKVRRGWICHRQN